MPWSLPRDITPVPSSALAQTCGRAELVPIPWEPGTETGLRALSVPLLPGHSNIQQIQSRNTLKDAIIIIQSVLLVVFISVPMLLFLDKVSGSIASSGDVPGSTAAVLTAVPRVLGRAVRALLGPEWARTGSGDMAT